MLRELVKKNRSCRRFYGNHTLSRDDLLDLVDLTRFCASGANIQPLKYMLSWTKSTNELIFERLHWAGYLKDWNGPEEDERPTGYIVILLDKEIASNAFLDHGIAAQTILLRAVEKGLGGCMIASIDRPELREDLSIPDRYEILLVVALGEPKERIVVENVKEGNIRYYRDEEGVHHVPKRSTDELIFEKDGTN
ncbi:MAG: nitroreductase family protein [Thermoplasmatota archaeon]